jgi:inorganic pyrophosphatase
VPQEIPPREADGDRVHLVIDTPAGSRNKYKYDEKLGVFRLSRILPQGASSTNDAASIANGPSPSGCHCIPTNPRTSRRGCAATFSNGGKLLIGQKLLRRL